MGRLKKPKRAELLLDQLARDIGNGVWQSTLPGSAVLAKYYGVSVRTCIDGLRLAETAGHISTAEKGKRRRILKMRKRAELITLLVVQPVDMVSPDVCLELAKICERHWVTEDLGPVIHKMIDLDRYKETQHYLRQWQQEFPRLRLLMVGAGLPWVEQARQMGLRCYFVGGGIFGPDADSCSGVGVSGVEILDAFFAFAQAGGHGQILIASSGDIDTPYMAERLEVQNRLHDRKKVEPSNQLVKFPLANPTAARAEWTRKFALERPSAVLVFNEVILLSLIAFCLESGIRVGRDLEIVLLQSQEWVGENFFPVLRTLSIDQTRTKRHFDTWMRGAVEVGVLYLPLEVKA
ncbi:hypothetical protein Rhal01_02255 [Rubritalea halochordaticola]|uniref:HTH gntR-type domain-containing protein n=1 Tax=Rubritalea halochordaticola TaxID=714537 RepID=A0ABP9V2C8_9BACT